ncbi:bifunctional TH2 protein, mitochondrial-like [Actinia tenebrosa]|uniref:Bifunctional TH2 protein, mitochondrial-like n=1 Tax=Actinia tenebrosa TaxID=6105 RepID=A0A6P8J5V2_ACTTE|nr:bifunctional TH2 protein, mitochondrial-like [Actinia tenebrosa]
MKLGRRITRYLFFIIIIIIAIRMNKITALSSVKMQKNSCPRDWPGLRVRFLAFDFDSTCTVEDTTGLYYKATETYRRASEAKSKVLDKEWESLGNTYLKGHKETIKRLLENVPYSENGNLSMEGLKSFLMETHNFDSECTKKVEASGLLSGISKEGIIQIAKNVQLSPGCVQVLGQVNLPLNVISFNWSKDLIQIVLGQLKHLRIAGNNFPTEDNKSTGQIDSHVSTSFDKEAEFMRLVEGQKEIEGLSVFIGDSIGDLLPLLKADVGIVIGNSNTMRKVAKAFGIKLLPLLDLYNRYGRCNSVQYDSSIVIPSTTDNNGILYEATSWYEIGELLLGNRLLPVTD